MILVKDILVLCLALAAKTLRYDMGGSYIGAVSINLSIQMLFVSTHVSLRYKYELQTAKKATDRSPLVSVWFLTWFTRKQYVFWEKVSKKNSSWICEV